MSVLLNEAVKVAEAKLRANAKLMNASAPLDMTRQLISNGLKDIESQGLGALEDTACGYFTGDAFGFCQWGFTKNIESYVNQQVMNIPLVQNVNNWLCARLRL